MCEKSSAEYQWTECRTRAAVVPPPSPPLLLLFLHSSRLFSREADLAFKSPVWKKPLTKGEETGIGGTGRAKGGTILFAMAKVGGKKKASVAMTPLGI